MGAVKSLWMDTQAEVESAVYDVVQDAKYLTCAPAEILAESQDWLEEARELLNDAIAKATRVREGVEA